MQRLDRQFFLARVQSQAEINEIENQQAKERYDFEEKQLAQARRKKEELVLARRKKEELVLARRKEKEQFKEL